jgi:hypothetical protein
MENGEWRIVVEFPFCTAMERFRKAFRDFKPTESSFGSTVPTVPSFKPTVWGFPTKCMKIHRKYKQIILLYDRKRLDI